MKLTQLFESKKEAKQRNPVAQELRANPQFKSKTEIDKKKEVKKGYQKHKNKVDESTDVDTAYVKKVIAQHSDEYKKFLDTGDLMDAPSVYEKLFAYFHFETGEMPYGTAKARDGDPYVWIADKLADLGLAEQVDYKTVDRFHKKLDKLVHKTFGHSSDEKKENIEVEENNMSTGTVGYGKKGKTRRATGIDDNPYNHNEGEDHPALVNAALWNMKDIYQTIMAGEEVSEDDMFSYGDVLQYLDMSGIPGYDFYEDFIDTVSTAVSQAQPGGFAGQGDAVLVDKKFASKIKTLYQQFKAATANIKGIKEELGADKEQQIKAWANKYKKYEGDNGDPLPAGFLEYHLNTGVPTDSIEAGEVKKYVDKYGDDALGDLSMEQVHDNPNDFPITNAFLKDLEKIFGYIPHGDEVEEIADVLRYYDGSKGIKEEQEDVNEADLNAWYAEQYAKELAEKEGKTWSRMSYGDKEDYRKIANKKYGVVKSEDVNEDLDDEARNFIDYIQDQGYKILSQGAGPRGISIEYQDREGGVHQVDFKDGKTFKEQDDVPTQKGRDAKHDVLTPRAKNKVLQQIKHDANKDRRSASKDIERMAKLAGISTASTDESVDQEAGIGHKGINLKFKIKDLIQLSKKYKPQSIDPRQFQKQIDSRQEDKSKSSARVAQADLSYPIIVVDFGNNDLMIADGTHRAQKAIQLNQKINAIIIPIADMGQFRVDQLEATQDLTRQLNPLRGVVGTNTSAQMTAKGLDALSKGQRPTPQQVKAVEPYVSSMAKAMQDPKTSAQMRNIIKKVN